MNKKVVTALLGVLLALSLVGCGASQNNNQSQSNTSKQSNQTSASSQLKKAFQDELNGFITIQQDINKGNYTSANTLAGKLHDEFHAAILPPLTAKKGKTYAENIHGKYDELQSAIQNKDKTKIKQLIKVNRNNLHTIAPILGVSL